MDSMRLSASRGEFACKVPIDPSWPVFIACRRSKASGPRTSPTMMRSGRMRRQFLTRSRMVICPTPSRFGGRVSSRTTWGLLELELGCVLAGDDSLVDVDIVGQAVEQRGLAGAGAAGNEDVAADAADDFENFCAGRGDRAEPHQL